MRFLMAMREKFPQFSQQGQGGTFMQQDAEECWTQFLYVLRERLREVGLPSPAAGITLRTAAVPQDTQCRRACQLPPLPNPHHHH